jgi:hypothetical protein
MTKFIRAVSTILLFAFLSACGGGGGSAGNTSGVALFTTAAIDIVIAPGETQTYNIGGGVPNYVATSNSSILSVSVSGKTLTIRAVGAGTATVVVNDSAGAKVSINAKVGTGVDFYTTAPGDVSLGVGQNSPTYQMGGGSLIYQVASGNQAIVSVVQIGSQFILTGISAGKTIVTATDSLGGKKDINVTVGSGVDLYVTAPSAVTVGIGQTSAEYRVGGGSQVYSISSSDVNVATVGLTTANRFIITGGTTGGKAVISIKDSLGKEVKIDVVVGTVDAIFSTAASDVNLAIGAAVTYKVGGGTTIYSVGSSNPGVATAAIVGNDLTITAIAGGTATVVVRDTTTGSLSIKVTVGTGVVVPLFSTAPSDVVIAPATTPHYTIGGGRAPYFVSSSNVGIVSASVTGTDLTLTANAVGTAKVLITDSAGAPLTINVTVGTGSNLALFTTAPTAVSLVPASTATYTVGGGTGPYTITSSNASVASVPSTPVTSSFTVTAGGAGSANILIVDAVGAKLTVAVTVSTVAVTPVTILPGDATGAVGDTLNFVISGGTAPYTVSNSNPTIATATPSSVSNSGGVVTALLMNQGSTILTVIDAQGVSTKITITSSGALAQLRISPSILTVGENTTGSIPLQINGGTGPYVAYTSDLVLSSVTVSGSTLTVGMGSQTNRCVTVRDSSGTVILGGVYPITLTVVDSKGASATSTFNIKDNATGGTVIPCP